MRDRGIRVVHVCATLGTGVVRRAGAIHRAIDQGLAARGIDIREYSVITGASQGALARRVGTRVLAILPDRDERIGANREWTSDKYLQDFARYEVALRQVFATELPLFQADLCISDQVPEIFDPGCVPPAPRSVFINDYFQELRTLGSHRNYIPQVLASNAHVLFADTELLLHSTPQIDVARQFGMRFHVAGPVIDYREWTAADRAGARERLRLPPNSLVVAVAHPSTPNLRPLLRKLAHARPLTLLVGDPDMEKWLRPVVSSLPVSVLTVEDWREALLAADVTLGKGGRVATYEALWYGLIPICDPFPDNEKETAFVRVLAEHGVVATPPTVDELLADPKRDAFVAQGRRVRGHYLRAEQLQVAVDEMLDQLSFT